MRLIHLEICYLKTSAELRVLKKKKKKRIITNVWLSEVADKREKIEPSDYSAFSHQQLEELMNNIIILLKGMK